MPTSGPFVVRSEEGLRVSFDKSTWLEAEDLAHSWAALYREPYAIETAEGEVLAWVWPGGVVESGDGVSPCKSARAPEASSFLARVRELFG